MSMRTANGADYLAAADDDHSLFGEAPGLAGDTFSVVDRYSSFDGTFRSDRDLRIEGEVKGTIECQGTLFVAQGATVTARVEAEHITVAGDLNGEIRCRGRLQLMPSGRVRGKVGTATLVVNEGAYYEGELEMAAPEDLGKAPARSLPPGEQAGAAAAPPQPIGDGSGGKGPNSTTFIRRLGSPETAWNSRRNDGGDAKPEAGDE